MPRTEVQNTKSGWTWLCFDCGEGGVASGNRQGGLYIQDHDDGELYDDARKSAREHQCLLVR
jgi:hypothetical protein